MKESEYDLIKKTVRKFAEERIAPKVLEMERNNCFDSEALAEAGKLGFVAPYLPETYRGENLDLKSMAIIYEELARVDAGFAMSAFVSGVLFGRNIYLWGTEEQRQKYLPPIAEGKKIGCWALTEPDAGSDAFSIQAKYNRQNKGYCLQGNKTFITNSSVADYCLVIARERESTVHKGATWFIVERDAEGISFSKPFEKMGLCSSPTGEIFLENVFISQEQILGKEGEGFSIMLKSLDVERCLGTSIFIGIAQACLEASIAYSKERKQFGKPIASFQLIKEKISEMVVGIELARTYMYHSLALAQNNIPINSEAAICKLFASQVAVRCASEAVQIHGGYGYIKEYNVERFYRNAKLCEIGGGTSEIQKLIIAENALEKTV